MFNSTHFHPMMVHFPIALILAGFMFDVVSLVWKKEPCLSRAGFWLQILGMAGAVFAFGTGYFLTSPMEGEAGLMREKHELFATMALVSIIVATLFRIVAIYLDKKTSGVRFTILGLYFISAVFISVTGFLGGNLVMDYMIGL
jgi:uncharacterized membrane protein